MQMEVETLSVLSWGFYIVIALSLMVIIRSFLSKKEKAFIWFIAQLFFLWLAFLKFIDLLKLKPEIPQVMLSEENSLAIGILGLLWAASMVCMMIGILNLNKRKKNI